MRFALPGQENAHVLSHREQDMADRGRLYVGTSGWSYRHWAGGRFYPKGLKPGDWLGYLAEQFPTVEINSTFYRAPTEAMVRRWRDTVGTRFRFAVKLWRMITHRKHLVDCDEQLRSFLAVAGGFGAKRGPLLVQLPPSLHKDLLRLDGFLGKLRAAMGRKRWRIAVEFRHASWTDAETTALLDDHNAALCLADMPHCPFTDPGSADFVYMRRHGPGGSYGGCYSQHHIADDARRVRAWLESGRDVYVYYNNDLDGHAVDNARQLLSACGREDRVTRP
jgi:uncharacterized protein YecE (DUF72 family)